MHGSDKKDNPSLVIADFYHKFFQYRQNAISFYLSKNEEGAVGAAVSHLT